ncbi:thiamine pyrophosphate-binding protein [Acuticoccus sp. I52.16.1]|uniref:thiamine pyrophosphate-binding protein n=1 Tax=Acuticoccus sp. I52.16.1 TaxID=2928472 RepID=UPI001FD35C1B|nr:thiamine pyrophosphate-binding protein [Acuticoccus sp. I52.16.1]UOM34817.1 thiamine pyrophosphate-binding protein [Acuticoccus sp. I52.16.1]
MTTRNADIIARKLAALGCAHAFGIPGGETLALMDALERAGIAFTLTKHENFAGFMAEGTWHATGAPGILVATIGPGLANAVNVIVNAHQDRVPLIVLTGCVAAHEADTYTHQVYDHGAMLAPIVKGTFMASGESLNRVVDKAIMLAMTGQPGPVHIDVPVPVAEAEATAEAFSPAGIGSRFQPVDGPEIERARKWIADAERPIAIAGVDAVNDDAGAAVGDFVKAIGAPLITTYKGKGLIDEAGPQALGGAGLSPLADGHILPLVAEADCVVLIGYDPIEMRAPWRDPWPDDARVIDVTPVVRQHGMHTAGATLYGSVSAALKLLQWSGHNHPTWSCGTPRRVRLALADAFAPEPSGWGPAAAFHAMREAVPEGTVATVDSGAHRILFSQIWRCSRPRTLLQSSALCTMGCAVPLAAGHKLAAPHRPVLAVVGDAGLEMTLGDLATVRDMKCPVPILVLVDESLALIEMKQRAGQLPNVGVDFPATDFVALAGAMGGHGVWIDDVATLHRETAAAFQRDTFTLLCARIGRRAYDGRI